MGILLTLRAEQPTNNYCPDDPQPREICSQHTSGSGHIIWACEGAQAEDTCTKNPN